MTKIPKKRSSKRYFLPAAALSILLIVFFIYATQYETKFFSVIFLFLLTIVTYLLYARFQFNKLRAETELKRQDCRERINLLEADIIRESGAVASFREKIVNYSQLKGLTEKLSLSLPIDDTSSTLSQEVNKLFGHEEHTVILYVFHSTTGELGISSSQKGQMQVNIKSKKGDVFDQWVVKTMQPLLIEDTKNDFRFDIDKISPEEPRPIRSLISVPLAIGHKAIGILRVDSPQENHFAMEDLRLLMTIGDLGAVAIENAQLYEKVEDLAVKDGLTGLYLRRYFLERLNEEIRRQLRRKKEMSFLMIDLDHFKKYNDRFGHMAGDIVLKAVAAALTEGFQNPGDLICRYGGEEFCVLLPDCPKAKAVELAEDLRKKIAGQTVILRREETRMTVSIGVATFPKDAGIREELIDRADKALYAAKTKGRNRVCAA